MQQRLFSASWGGAAAALFAAALLLSAAGCGGGGGGSKASSYTTQSYTEDGVSSRSTTDSSTGVVTTVSVPKTDYIVGETITVTATQTNTGSLPVNVEFSAQNNDLFVRTSAIGDPLFNTYYGKGVPQSFTFKSLAPGASQTSTLEWNQFDDFGKPVEPGVYQLTVAAFPTLPVYVTVHPAQAQ